MHEGGEFHIGEEYNRIPFFGEQIGLFHWGNLNLGIEVCADHGILANNNINNLDLLLSLCSGKTLTYDNTKTLREGGYFIHVDGDDCSFFTAQKEENESFHSKL